MGYNQQIPKEELLKIRDGVGKIENFLDRAIEWTLNSPDVEDPKQTAKTLKKYRRNIRKVAGGIMKKPAIAFFGASQSAKSHLVKNLLQNESKKCEVLDAGRNNSIDFIKCINPDGDGNESTAIVTRFTLKEAEIENLPIKIELLSIRDIVLCLCEGFYKVFSLAEATFPTEPEVQELLSKVEMKASSDTNLAEKSILSEDDIYLIKEYLENYHSEKIREFLILLETTGYWDQLAQNLHRIQIDNLVSLLGILWLNQKDLSDLFFSLMRNLNKLKFTKTVYSDFDVVFKYLPQDYEETFSDGYRPGYNILDVTTLNDQLYSDNVSFTVSLADGEVQSISPGMLCAISKELTFRVSPPKPEDSERKFLEDIDIIDFPGVREAAPRSIKESVKQRDVAYVLLRGKVNYLFNSYSDNYDINNLAVTTDISAQKDGSGLIPEIIDKWIKNYIGRDMSERKDLLAQFDVPPLFIILTFWNEKLKFDQAKSNPNPLGSLKMSFKTRFYEDILSDKEWQTNWSGLNSRDKESFRNFYLLRDFNYSEDVFSQDENGFEQQVLESNKEYYNSFKEEFLKLDLVNQYFNSPLEMWENSSTFNKDGAELIIKNLSKITSNAPKTNRYISIINSAFNKAFSELNILWNDDDIGRKILSAKRESEDIVSRTSLLMDENQHQFGKLIELFMINELDIYDHIYIMTKSDDISKSKNLKKYFTFRKAHKIEGMPQNEALDKLKEQHGYTLVSELENYLKNDLKLNLDLLFSKNIEKMQKRSVFIASRIKDYWIDNILRRDNYNVDSTYRIDDKLGKKVSDILRINFSRLNMEEVLAKSIENYVDTAVQNEEAVPMIADILAGTINNFVKSVGWEYTNHEDRQDLIETARKHNISIHDFSINNDAVGKISKQELDEVYEFMADYEKRINEADDDVIVKTPILHNLFKWQDHIKLAYMGKVGVIHYDVESNNRLDDILKNASNLSLKSVNIQ